MRTDNIKEKEVALTLYNINIWEYLLKDKNISIDKVETIDDFDIKRIFCKKYNELSSRHITWEENENINIYAKIFYLKWEEKTFFWNDFLSQISDNMPKLTSKKPSFIIFLFNKSTNSKSNKLYAVTGWSWYHEITNHINNNFWFDIIARLLDKEDKKKEFIRYLEDKKLVWNVDYESRSFRRLYSIMYDNSYWSIYKDMILSLDAELLEKIWITELNTFNKKNNVWVAITSGLHIRKKISFEKLVTIINKISLVYVNDPQIAFNKLEHIDKNYHKDELSFIKLQAFSYIETELINNKNLENFSIWLYSPEFYTDNIHIQYWLEVHQIKAENDQIQIDILNTILDIYEQNKDKIKEIDNFLLNLKIVWESQKIYGSILRTLEFEFTVDTSNNKYFYIWWEFYKVKDDLEKNINIDFSDFYNNETYFKTWSNTVLNKKWTEWREDEYNSSYEKENNFFVFDKITPSPWSIELCDLLYIDPITKDTHLYHIKDWFWQSVRDLVYQVEISTKLIRDYILDNDNNKYLEAVYKAAISRNKKIKSAFTTKLSFCNIFKNLNSLHIHVWIRYRANDWNFFKAKTLIPKVSLLDLQKSMNNDLNIKNFDIIKIEY